MNNWPHQALVASFYGNPDSDHNGFPDRKWEDEALIDVEPPYRMVLAWDKARPVKRIRIHKKCANSLITCLKNIALHFGSEQDIEANRLHLFGGAYNFRLMRGSTKLSMHAYGCAIDLDPELNYLGRRYKESDGMLSMAVVKIFEAEGWNWGGYWLRPDCMHLEAVNR